MRGADWVKQCSIEARFERPQAKAPGRASSGQIPSSAFYSFQNNLAALSLCPDPSLPTYFSLGVRCHPPVEGLAWPSTRSPLTPSGGPTKPFWFLFHHIVFLTTVTHHSTNLSFRLFPSISNPVAVAPVSSPFLLCRSPRPGSLVPESSRSEEAPPPTCRTMALEVQPPSDPKRVKVYELRDNDWFDRGTGFCTGQILDVRNLFAAGRAPRNVGRATQKTSSDR